MLSTALCRLCHGKESEEAAEAAVRVLEALPPGPELAWAYANLGATYITVGRTDEGVEFIGMARTIGERLHEPAIVSYALNATGLALVDRGEDGTEVIERALEIALEADLQESAGRAYTSLQEVATSVHKFDDAERFFTEGMTYCEEHELRVLS